MTDDDPRCPECGGPIGQTATYCMHCSADLTDERDAADTDDDGMWDEVDSPGASSESGGAPRAGDGRLLDPDGFLDDSLTILVGIVGGTVVGLVGTVVLGVVTASVWTLPFGLLAWLVAMAYLVRHRTVQGAISKSAYAVAAVLLLVPVIALSPVSEIDGGLGARGGLFVALLLFVAVPAVIAATVGWVASRFVPPEASDGRE